MYDSIINRSFIINARHRAVPCREIYRRDEKTAAVIIGLHGFGGSKESGAITLLGEKMPDNTRLIAFDFAGHGASDSTPLTVEGCINDLLSAVEYAEKSFPSAKINIFATSFGGYIALLSEEKLRGRVSRIVLRAPAVEMGKTLIEHLIASPKDFKARGFAAATVGSIHVDYSFYEELRKNDIFLLRPQIPILMICAEKDELVSHAAQVRFSELNPSAKRIDIEGAGHRFMGEGQLDAAIDAALKYFQEVTMDRIASFQINHLTLLPGLYVSRRDKCGECVVTTFDMRITAPNREPVVDTPALHTIEHMAATYLRNCERKDEIVYFGPMGCRTGCYIVMFGDLCPEDIYDTVVKMCDFILGYEGEIPGAKPEECGNYSEQNLNMAKYYISKYRRELTENKRFKYDG